MNINTQYHGFSPYSKGDVWTATDDDTYDGAPDSNWPVGWGYTEKEAINNLVEQIVERLEDRIDDLRGYRLQCQALREENDRLRTGQAEAVVKALNRANLTRLEGKSEETSPLAAPPCPPDEPSAVLTFGEGCEITTGLQGRISDDPATTRRATGNNNQPPRMPDNACTLYDTNNNSNRAAGTQETVCCYRQ